jgi:hypothetical protein
MTEFPDKPAARRALSGPQQQATNRFFRGATSKSRDFKITDLGNGSYRLEFFSPSRNPDFGKRYIQEIGLGGEVVREFKETLGPHGIIETKWIHGGPHI